MKFILLAVLLLVTSCDLRPKRAGGGGKNPGVSDPSGNGSASNKDIGVIDLEPTDSFDSYMSVGNFLQKELDATTTSGKIVKVYVMIRQENSVKKNFDFLKSSISPITPAITEAIDAAKNKGISTVEFDVDLKALKDSISVINKAVSAIEISLSTVE